MYRLRADSRVKKIADYAALTRTPVALHNVGSMIRTYASAHLSMSIQNFYRSESRLGRPEGIYERMVAEARPAVQERHPSHAERARPRPEA